MAKDLPDTEVDVARPGAEAYADTELASTGSSQPVALPTSPPPMSDFAARYDEVALLGAGGMGEVRLYRDRHIGRDVAMKVIRHQPGAEALRARFEREARIQAQLEHPAIVPVHEVGSDEDGRSYFTMKRIRGKSLADVLSGHAQGDEKIVQAYPRRRLLAAFDAVCLAIAFAHSRGVIHRDIKPANIMLGEFGEVNVLDWGVAKLMDADEADDERVESDDVQLTAVGSVIGTPGYMAPEQIQGDSVGPPTDVYALGAVLFEILTLAPLCSGPNAEAMFARTVGGLDTRPSSRAPGAEVPVELDDVVVRATAAEPEDRFASAREMAEAVEKFMDGDRDLDRRRVLAAEHAEEARRATRAPASVDTRQRALREASLALALDPSHAGAVDTLVELLVDTPRELPPEAEAELDRARQAQLRISNRSTVPAILMLLLLAPVILWLGVQNWFWFGFLVVLIPIVAFMNYEGSKRLDIPRGLRALGLGASFLLLLPIGLLFGPLVLLPMVSVVFSSVSLLMYGADRALRWFCAVASLAVVLGPLALELLGVITPSYQFEEGMMKIVPGLAALPELPTLVFLTLAAVTSLLASNRLIARSVMRVASAERKLFSQAWHLRALVPEAARGERNQGT